MQYFCVGIQNLLILTKIGTKRVYEVGLLKEKTAILFQLA